MQSMDLTSFLHSRLLAILQVYQGYISAGWYCVEQGKENRL